MRVVFRNDKPADDTIPKYYKCKACSIEFRWEDGCLSKLIIEGYNDYYECLCKKCSLEHENKTGK